MANVAATPMTRRKCPVTKSSVTEVEAKSCRARNRPEIPPERKSETKPRANNKEVFNWKRAFQSVANQLTSRIVAGNPREEARTENTSGEKGFRALENMCWPQTQNPTRPTPQSARTTSRSLQIGLREKVAIKWETMPKHGSIAM